MQDLPRKAVVVIPCHNQQTTVELCISRLEQQTVKPCKIIVVDDHSDRRPTVESSLTEVISAEKKGRSSTRNLGISEAMRYNADIIIFLDGDAIPADLHFIENHLAHHAKGTPSLVFGLRQHIPRPRDWHDYSGSGMYLPIDINRLPSDLLTANMDALASGRPLDYTDLRVVSGAYGAYNGAKEFSEKCDLILSGMVTWSCNFSLNFRAAHYIRETMMESYGIPGWFDDNMFNDGWGYEDVALGVDALFAGVGISICGDIGIKHFMHERSDDLSSHILGRHRIMERYRKHLAESKKGTADDVQSFLLASGYSVALSTHSLNINGRLLVLPEMVTKNRTRNTLQTLRGTLYVNGYAVDVLRGEFRRSFVGSLMFLFAGV